MRDYKIYLNDILAAVESIEAFVQDMSFKDSVPMRQNGWCGHQETELFTCRRTSICAFGAKTIESRNRKQMDWTIVSAMGAIAAALYTWVVSGEQRKTRLDDKFPCMVVRCRNNPATKVDELRLVNAGRGPAFITKFVVKGLDKLDGIHRYVDGDHIDGIDRVIGPEMKVIQICSAGLRGEILMTLGRRRYRSVLLTKMPEAGSLRVASSTANLYGTPHRNSLTQNCVCGCQNSAERKRRASR